MSEKNIKKCHNLSCYLEGLYKAPKFRGAHIKDYDSWYYFCKEHVREYNAAWNYLDGMNEDEIYQTWKRGLMGDRPTFDLTSPLLKKANLKFSDFEYIDKFKSSSNKKFSKKEIKSYSPDIIEALHFFKLGQPPSKQELMEIYRKFVKKFHPDLNMGSLESEEKLKKTLLYFKLLEKMMHVVALFRILFYVQI
ncbi:MAG: hypothetical protein C0432_00085 [Candidatus Puniceispirillum sp.]|nr:hypothetical protein [Candidatus Pelagibacter sp.]MBA4282682.1 hypothetical protein [Candidatus Puniceispirillum sp.]